MSRAPVFEGVLFDMFDTLVRFERERLPLVEIDGVAVRSTVGCLHEVLRTQHPQVGLGELYAALLASWRAAEAERAREHREVSGQVRFAGLLDRLGITKDPGRAALVEALLDTHGQALRAACVFPDAHRRLVRALAGRLRLGIVSNFDYSPTLHAVLEREGVRGLFAPIVVSDAVGWRKPRPEIFAAGLAGLGLPASRVVFVGDRPDIDVAGARAAGLPAAWVNPAREPLPPGVDPPLWELRELPELGALLGL